MKVKLILILISTAAVLMNAGYSEPAFSEGLTLPEAENKNVAEAETGNEAWEDAGFEAYDYVQGYALIEPYMPDVSRMPEDFADLYTANPHFAGWLTAGDNIDYPVVLYDDDFYLHHDFYGQESANGTLFVEEWNILDPRDWLVIIFGHHMRSGEMFGRLQAYENYDYVLSHPLIEFPTIYDSQDEWYVPVAGFNASMEEDNPDFFSLWASWTFLDRAIDSAVSEMNSQSRQDISEAKADPETEQGTVTGPESEQGTVAGPEIEQWTVAGSEAETETEAESGAEPETDTEVSIVERNRMNAPTEMVNEKIHGLKAQYLEDMLGRSLWEPLVPVDALDEFLMLVTCSYYHNDGRFILLCRKLREGETPENIWGEQEDEIIE